MIKPSSNLTALLAAATRLMHASDAAPSEIIRVGQSRFRLMTEFHPNAGWLVVLFEESASSDICDDVLKACGLTTREIQVARLLVERHSNKEIAEMLSVTAYTAGRHTEHILKKLGVASRRDVRHKLNELSAPDQAYTSTTRRVICQ